MSGAWSRCSETSLTGHEKMVYSAPVSLGSNDSPLVRQVGREAFSCPAMTKVRNYFADNI